MNDEKRTLFRPIGYWIKKADEALTSRIGEAQKANGLSRTEWQVINSLNKVHVATEEQLGETLHAFADAALLRDIIGSLVERGLVEREVSAAFSYRLSDRGRGVHEAALILQKEVRKQAVEGISETDYVTTVRVLEKLVENLTGGDAAQQGVAADGAAPRP